MYNNQTVLAKVLSAIEKAGITEKECLISSGVNTSFLTDWKKGKIKSPSFDKIVKIAVYLGLSLDDLVDNHDCNSPNPEVDSNTIELIETFNLPDSRGKTMVKATAYRELERLEQSTSPLPPTGQSKEDEPVITPTKKSVSNHSSSDTTRPIERSAAPPGLQADKRIAL